MNEIKEYRLKDKIKRQIVTLIDLFYLSKKKISKESIVEMLEELIILYKN